MCGRFTYLFRWRELHKLMRLATPPDAEQAELPLRYNIAPSQTVPVVISTERGREAAMHRWGLVPAWSKDLAIAYKTINARSETAATSPAFRSAFKARRCLVPVSGFYEWQKLEAKTKQPWYITPADEGGVFAFAGLWEEWKGQDPPLRTFTILTTTPNEFMAPIHDRMPVILEPEDWDGWLKDGDAALLKPCSPDRMAKRKVSTRVNKPGNDDAACIAAVV